MTTRLRGIAACAGVAACAHGVAEAMSIARTEYFSSSSTTSGGRSTEDGCERSQRDPVEKRVRPSPVPTAPLAVGIGAVSAHLVFRGRGVPETLAKGVKWCAGDGLKVGIAALGAKLSLSEISDFAGGAAPAIAATVATGVLVTPMINAAVMARYGATSGLSGKVGALLAAGSSICGVTAIGALSPAIAASQREVSLAVANVVAYGTFGMMTYPYLAKWMFPDGGVPAGVFLGLSVHDTSQVVGAAMTYRDAFEDEVAFKAATVTKLTRNLALALAIPYLAMSFRETKGVMGKQPALVPGFLIAFVSMAALRSIGDSMENVRQDPRWKAGTKALGDFSSQLMLPMAMAAVGLSTNAASLRGIGPAPFIVGALAATSVGAVAAGSTMALSKAGRL